MNDGFQIILAVIEALIALILALVGWIMNRLSAKVDALDQDVRDIPKTYVTKEDFRADLHDIKALLQRIDEKLDGKADK